MTKYKLKEVYASGTISVKVFTAPTLDQGKYQGQQIRKLAISNLHLYYFIDELEEYELVSIKKGQNPWEAINGFGL